MSRPTISEIIAATPEDQGALFITREDDGIDLVRWPKPRITITTPDGATHEVQPSGWGEDPFGRLTVDFTPIDIGPGRYCAQAAWGDEHYAFMPYIIREDEEVRP